MICQTCNEKILEPNDLIAFSKWVKDKMYGHRLDLIPSDLVSFYFENRDNIIKMYGVNNNLKQK